MFEEAGTGPFYADPGPEVRFGDVFEAPFLLDLFARADTTLMGGGTVAPNLSPKVGAWMGTTLPQEALDLYSPRFTPKEANRFALAHATFLPNEDLHRAVLVSDSCLAATALAQGRQKRSVGGRLLFAPLGTVEEERWQKLADDPDFERFPLLPDDRLPDFSVAELRHCFMVDARDVSEHTDARIASPTSGLAEELEVHWNAYATRRGPRAYERNVLKLGFLLAGGTQPEEAQERVGDAIAEVLDCAWALESADLEAVSEAEELVRHADGDANQLTPDLVARLGDTLRRLAGLASDAADQLDARR